MDIGRALMAGNVNYDSGRCVPDFAVRGSCDSGNAFARTSGVRSLTCGGRIRDLAAPEGRRAAIATPNLPKETSSVSFAVSALCVRIIYVAWGVGRVEN